jgi:hypothetical protein
MSTFFFLIISSPSFMFEGSYLILRTNSSKVLLYEPRINDELVISIYTKITLRLEYMGAIWPHIRYLSDHWVIELLNELLETKLCGVILNKGGPCGYCLGSSISIHLLHEKRKFCPLGRKRTSTSVLKSTGTCLP